MSKTNSNAAANEQTIMEVSALAHVLGLAMTSEEFDPHAGSVVAHSIASKCNELRS